MFGTLNDSAGQTAAAARVEAWVRQRFSLPPSAAVVVTELRCQQPGCPPLETVVVFWTEGTRRHRIKIFKPLPQVLDDDLPPYWMRGALEAQSDDSGDCC